MELSYGGVNLELVALDRVDREAVYSSDGIDLIAVKWVIGATCVYSPGGRPVGTAATQLGKYSTDYLYDTRKVDIRRDPASLRGRDPKLLGVRQETNYLGGVVGAGAVGYNAAMTDVELRTRLFLPRQRLLITAYDQNGRKVNWLQSPKPGFGADVMGGPRPLSVDIVSAQGEGMTFGVYFQIETYTSPCPDGSDRIILSHRWQMTHDHDENNYLTRIIEGEVVFDLGIVSSNNIRPDLFRQQFFHPIPLGAKRKLGPIVQSSDGSTIKYTTYDTDTSITFDAGDSGATNIAIVEKLSYSQGQRVI